MGQAGTSSLTSKREGVPRPGFDLGFILGSAAAGCAAAAVISIPGLHALWQPMVAAVVIAAALAVSPNVFLVAAFLFFSLLQLTANHSFSAGPASLYLSDLFLVVLTMRALSPRVRIDLPSRLHGLTLGAFAVWVVLMAVAMGRGYTKGAPLDTVVRSGLAVFYWPILYFGFWRVLREAGVDYKRLLRAVVAIGVGLTAYMFLMRVLNRPFESTDQSTGHLGQVVSSTGEVFHRDFGFWSAYIVYPIVALIAVGRLIYARERRLLWLVVACLSIAATLTTLIRSEIYGLIAGIAVVLLLSKDAFHDRFGRTGSPRVVAALMLASVLLATGAVVAAVSPGFARAVGERSIPTYGTQSDVARENAEYRIQALTKGVSVANDHPAGLGMMAPSQLAREEIDPGFFAHSGPATLLIFAGWPGLVAAILVLIGLGVDSARAKGLDPWWHPVLVGVLVMLVGNSFGAISIVGQEFVIGITAFVVALRFAAARSATPP